MTYIFIEQLNKLRTEIITLENFEDKLRKWAEFTVDYCDNVARHKIDRSFYVFQSEPSFEPEVLILGLNPQDQYRSKYINQYENPSWGLTDYNKMTAEALIHQNPWYIGGQQAEKEKEWNILRNLNKTINVHYDLSQLFNNMVYMNILYFNSTDFVEFKKSFRSDWKEVFENCVGLSSLLIYEIIKPKRIICLGIDNCYNSFIGNLPNVELLNRSLYKCKNHGVDIYGITHPSARITNLEREMIGWHLYADWFEKPIITNIQDRLTIIENIFLDIADEYNLILDFNRTKIIQRFGSFKFIFTDERNQSIYFEFQQSFLSDLRFELHNGKFVRNAKRCKQPYNNWILFYENFNEADFKTYFKEEIYSLIASK